MSTFDTTHDPLPIDEYGDPALMCLACLVCECCEPERARAECKGEPEWLEDAD